MNQELRIKLSLVLSLVVLDDYDLHQVLSVTPVIILWRLLKVCLGFMIIHHQISESSLAVSLVAYGQKTRF